MLVSVDLPVRDDVAGLVHVELPAEERGVRVVPDGDEEPVGLELGLLAGLHVANENAGHAAVLGAEHLLDDGVEDELDAVVRAGAVDHDGRRTEGLTSVDDGHLGRELGEEGRLLHRGVAAADHDHLALLEERGVADSAVGDSAALQGLLGLEAELACVRAGGDDDRLGAVLRVADPDAEGALGEVDPRHVVGDELGAEALRLLAEVLHHLGPEDPVRVPGVVLHVARDHQLAAPGEAFDDERVEVRPRRIEGSGVAGGPPADDDHFAHVVRAHCILSVDRIHAST